ncbi:hypothetical protein C8J56DRAFT_853803 [Mycena floridula]|nr:hypothetical protein C8J56DRAFT_853803 [Mycena floridula]
MTAARSLLDHQSFNMPFTDPSTPVYEARAVSSSEAASLHGRKAKTPILAGAICGSVMGFAWLVGFTIYFYKRWRHKKRKREGLLVEKENVPIPGDAEQIIIPPDPAVISGQRKPGEHAFSEDGSTSNTTPAVSSPT